MTCKRKVYYVVAVKAVAQDNMTGGNAVKTYFGGKDRVLHDCTAVYLLDVQTGCILLRPLVGVTENSVCINGLPDDAVVNFAEIISSDGFKTVWTEYDPMCLYADLTFLCVTGSSCRYITSLDDRWDLVIIGSHSIAPFVYLIVPRGTFDERLVKEDVTLCPFIQCYCDTMIRMQNRAMLLKLGANSDEFIELAIMQLLAKFKDLSDAELREMPCDVGIQTLKHHVKFIENTCGAFAFCFDITSAHLKEAAKKDMPFLYLIASTVGGKRPEPLKAGLFYSPNTKVRLID